MSTGVTLHIESTSSSATEEIAAKMGNRLKGGEVIELMSDLGGGKTTFVRGLARGAGSRERVASPTFTISKVYTAPAVDIWHFDFYRLQDAGITAAELQEAASDPRVVTVVEWGEAVQSVLPPERLTVQIKPTGNDSRQLIITCPDSLQYLIQDYADSNDTNR